MLAWLDELSCLMSVNVGCSDVIGLDVGHGMKMDAMDDQGYGLWLFDVSNNQLCYQAGLTDPSP